jgi:SAM-dependent methyltransferase
MDAHEKRNPGQSDASAAVRRSPISKGRIPMAAHPEWWDGFFTGLMAELWQTVIPPEATSAEVEFFERVLELPPGARVLDVPCGHGRHALELARKGYRVTGVDGSPELLGAAERRAAREAVAVELHFRDMRDLPWSGEFDAAFCAGNSFGYFEPPGDRVFLEAVARALHPKGRFLLDSGWIAECLFPEFRERLDLESAGIRFEVENRYEPRTGCVESRFTATRGDRRESRPGRHRVYTCAGLIALLSEVGFDEFETFGTPAGDPFVLGSHRLLLLARRR